jgi:hypothetical protein
MQMAQILFLVLLLQLAVVEAVAHLLPQAQVVRVVVEITMNFLLVRRVTLHLQVHHKEITVGLVEETAAVKFLLGAVVAAQVVWVVMRQVHRQTPQVVTAVLEPLHQSQAQA